MISAPSAERPRLQIITPSEDVRQIIGDRLSHKDAAIVLRALEENQRDNRHPIVALRFRTTDGGLRYKMKLNGQSNRICVVFADVGEGRIVVESVEYRGNAYKD